MDGNVRRSGKPILAASGAGLIATFIVGAIAAAWPTGTDVGSVVGLRAGPLDASTVSTVQGSGQWTPFGAEPFLLSGTLVPTPDSGRMRQLGFRFPPRQQDLEGIAASRRTSSAGARTSFRSIRSMRTRSSLAATKCGGA
jgi:hypothetical protein